MTSETAPLCEHGLMVPINSTFAYVGIDGKVKALIKWNSRRHTEIFALLPDGVPPEVPLWGSDTMGEAIQFLRDGGQLVEYSSVIAQMEGLFRVDDARPGQNLSYVVWHGSGQHHPGMHREMVYGYFPNGRADSEQQAGFPLWVSPSDLAALMAQENTRPITALEQIGLTQDDEMIPEHNSLLVWDMGALFGRGGDSR